MNFETARYNMIEQQIRPWNVLDLTVLNLLDEIHREDFVPAAYKSMAFSDFEIPLGNGEHMLAPRVEARLLQELNVQPHETVLEIGTGSGYMTALLAQLALRVFSVEIDQDLSTDAGRKLASHDISNVTLEIGDAASGWDNHTPYDVILLTGSTPKLSDKFEQSLNINGRLLAVVGDEPNMEVQRITRISDSEFKRENLFETVIPALKNAPEPARFSF
ncbi:Protein-L-isoaspartate O-methyltransferase [hydrothermal vent metagenome]|uniref:Protein-L-isoaspartate O-methyltransferase n=1 Tax=hydrothermal vent metagenome TaxID=652676 RepID=A0A3B1AYW8_9ZZZZ